MCLHPLKLMKIAACALLTGGGLNVMPVGDRLASAQVAERPQNSIDPERVSLAAKQAELGTDVKRIFEFVRDRIRIEPYRGVLRGARGTLISEAGNSIDKTLLLQDLLTKAGYQARLVRGTLDQAQANILLKATIERLPQPVQLAAAHSEFSGFIQALTQETTAHYFSVIKALTDAGRLGPSIQEPPSPGLNFLDHYWLQYSVGGNWIDLDSSFPDSQPGQVYATPQGVLDSLPESLFHRVVVRVILEEDSDSKRRKRTLLTFESRAADLSAKSLVITHVKGSWAAPTPIATLQASVAKALGAIGGSTRENTAKPILIVGEKDYRVGEVFDITHPDNEAGQGGSGGGGGLGGLVDRLGGPPRAMAVAEWIEFDFISPGGKVESTQRTIFDRVGFAQRATGATAASKDRLARSHPILQIFCLTFTTGPLANRALFRSDIAGTADEIAGRPAILNVAATLVGFANAVFLLGDGLTSPLSIDGKRVAFIQTTPRLTITNLKMDRSGLGLSVDLRRDGYEVVAESAELQAKAFRLQVLRGVLNGVAESRVLGDDANNTAAAFRRNKGQGGPVVVTDAGAPELAALRAEARARISADLANGQIVILPPLGSRTGNSIPAAWWRVDARIGFAVGVTEDGLHATEYGVLNHPDGTHTVLVYETEGFANSMVVNLRTYLSNIDSKLLAQFIVEQSKQGWNLAWKVPALGG